MLSQCERQMQNSDIENQYSVNITFVVYKCAASSMVVNQKLL